MSSAKVISLDVRALQVSHLCFETSGILLDRDGGSLNQPIAQLGDTVTAFNFPAFYALLGSAPTIVGEPSRLLGSSQILDHVIPFALASLRAEPARAALDKAVNARQNAFFAKYDPDVMAAIITQIQAFYSPSSAVPGTKLNRLALLSTLADNQANILQGNYLTDGRDGVVKTTSSQLTSHTDSSGDSRSTGQSNEEQIGATEDIPLGGSQEPSSFDVPLPQAGGAFTNTTLTTGSPGGGSISLQEGTSSDQTMSSGHAREFQRIVNTDYGYRMPFLESEAQRQRAQVSLIDEQFAQVMQWQNLPNLATVYRNELSSIDADVRQLQIAYLNTILMSPIEGTVTGVYKNPGDAVRAGEPVLRVENSSVVLLTARLIYPGRISSTSTVTVETQLFEQPGPLTQASGNPISIRGQSEDNQWEITFPFTNLDPSANPIFPLGYQFDYDNTTVTIS